MENLNGYKAFYNGKECEVYAQSSYQAQLKACEIFKPSKKNAHMVHVHLCEKAGEQIVHTAVD